MKIIVAIEVPERFIQDAYANAEGDSSRGITPIPFPAHSAVRSLIESVPIKVQVMAVKMTIDAKEVIVEYENILD